MDRFVPDDFIIENPAALETDEKYFPPHVDHAEFLLKTRCFYLFKYEEIYGNLILKKDCLVFEPFDPRS